MGEAVRDDALEVGENRLHGVAGFRGGVGDLAGDVTRLRLRAHRPLAQARAIVRAPVGNPSRPVAEFFAVHILLPVGVRLLSAVVRGDAMPVRAR